MHQYLTDLFALLLLLPLSLIVLSSRLLWRGRRPSQGAPMLSAEFVFSSVEIPDSDGYLRTYRVLISDAEPNTTTAKLRLPGWSGAVSVVARLDQLGRLPHGCGSDTWAADCRTVPVFGYEGATKKIIRIDVYRIAGWSDWVVLIGSIDSEWYERYEHDWYAQSDQEAAANPDPRWVGLHVHTPTGHPAITLVPRMSLDERRALRIAELRPSGPAGHTCEQLAAGCYCAVIGTKAAGSAARSIGRQRARNSQAADD